MKKNKTKGLLVIILLGCLLALIPSCQKKTDGSDYSSIAGSLISSAKSSIQPVVVVPSPSSSRKSVEENVEEEETTESIEPEKEEVIETVSEIEAPLPSSSSSASLVIDSVMPEASGKEETVVDIPVRIPAAPVFKSVTSIIVEVDDTPIRVSSIHFSYRGIESDLTAYTDHAEITVPNGVTDEDIRKAATLLLEAYPYMECVTYSVSDGVVELEYPQQSEADITYFVDILEKEAKYYIDTIFTSLAEVVESASSDEQETGHTFVLTEDDVVETVEENDVEEVIPSAVPVTEKGRFVKSYSVAFSDTPYLEAKYTGFSNIFSADVLISFTDRFSAGLKVGYDLKKYLSIEAEAKYSFTSNIYMLGGIGYRFGFSEVSSYSSVFLSLSLGYELAVRERITIFGEAGLIFIPNGYSAFNPSITFGIRYTF